MAPTVLHVGSAIVRQAAEGPEAAMRGPTGHQAGGGISAENLTIRGLLVEV